MNKLLLCAHMTFVLVKVQRLGIVFHIMKYFTFHFRGPEWIPRTELFALKNRHFVTLIRFHSKYQQDDRLQPAYFLPTNFVKDAF